MSALAPRGEGTEPGTLLVVGQGDSYEEALSDVRSAIHSHVETFGEEVLENGSPVLEAFVAEAEVR